jgi:hypothetical protein
LSTVCQWQPNDPFTEIETVPHLVAETDDAVVTEWSWAATHTETGKRLSMKGLSVFEFSDIIGDYRAFAAQQRDRLATRGIDISPYELSPPVHQRVYKMGLEHLGVVVGDTFDAFVGAHKPVLTGQQFHGPNSTPDPVDILFVTATGPNPLPVVVQAHRGSPVRTREDRSRPSSMIGTTSSGRLIVVFGRYGFPHHLNWSHGTAIRRAGAP